MVVIVGRNDLEEGVLYPSLGAFLEEHPTAEEAIQSWTLNEYFQRDRWFAEHERVAAILWAFASAVTMVQEGKLSARTLYWEVLPVLIEALVVDAVYVVTSGSYDDYTMRGMFDTAEKAKTFIRSVFQDPEKADASLGIWELNEYASLTREGHPFYRVRIQKDGVVRSVERLKDWEVRIDLTDYPYARTPLGNRRENYFLTNEADLYLQAKDEEDAKVVGKKFLAKLLIEDRWPWDV